MEGQATKLVWEREGRIKRSCGLISSPQQSIQLSTVEEGGTTSSSSNTSSRSRSRSITIKHQTSNIKRCNIRFTLLSLPFIRWHDQSTIQVNARFGRQMLCCLTLWFSSSSTERAKQRDGWVGGWVDRRVRRNCEGILNAH